MAVDRTERGALAAAIGLSLLFAGCGRVSPVGGVPAYEPPPVQAFEPSPLPAATPQPLPPAPPRAGLPAPCDPLAGCDVHAQLVVGGLEKKRSGFLWRKLRVKGTVTNRGGQPLDGEVVVRFKKGGQVVQSEFVALAALAPGQVRAVEMVSAVAADDAEVMARVL
ncbi:MAG: hypothetical protein VKS61_02585 [Candidatus Sericytochromatia bacterium]|nr:hypothetical protein [Candidatus Sericytochromatia bacterium]